LITPHAADTSVVIRTDRTVKARLDCRVADFVMLSSPARGDVGILGDAPPSRPWRFRPRPLSARRADRRCDGAGVEIGGAAAIYNCRDQFAYRLC
jgi:hypothetical protein